MPLEKTRTEHWLFNRMLKVSITLTYLVILAGSVVRSTGSGMGCPDWPRCFGQWVPPTTVDQLPEGYEDDHVQHRRTKNLRYADLLDKVGQGEVAQQLRNDPAMYAAEPFNAVKTWIEYANRLIGALLGISLFICLLLSLKYWGLRSLLPFQMLAIVVLTGFQGWFGSIVVSTNLLPGTITIHMVLALVILMGLVRLYVETSPGKRVNASFQFGNTMRYALWTLLIITLIQILLGTQVRQQIDVLAAGDTLRASWIDQLNWKFTIHRSFSLVVLGLTAWLFYQVNRYMANYWVIYRMMWFLAVFVGLEVLTGISMAYLGMPGVAQPIHMLVSSMIVGAQTYMLTSLSSRRQIGAA